MDRNMIGFSTEYYTITNADGHDLALQGERNEFQTKEMAVRVARKVCQEYKDTVLIRKCTTAIVGAFTARISVEEVNDTSTMAS